MSSTRVLILGVGSTFGADQLGWHAVDGLAQGGMAEQFPPLAIEFRQSDRPGSALLNLLQGYGCAIVIDAMRAAVAPGTIRRFTPAQLSAETGLISSHGFGVAEALALGRVLGQLPEQLIVYGIEIGTDLANHNLPDGALERLRECVVTDLTNWQGRDAACA